MSVGSTRVNLLSAGRTCTPCQPEDLPPLLCEGSEGNIRGAYDCRSIKEIQVQGLLTLLNSGLQGAEEPLELLNFKTNEGGQGLGTSCFGGSFCTGFPGHGFGPKVGGLSYEVGPKASLPETRQGFPQCLRALRDLHCPSTGQRSPSGLQV